MNVGIGIATRLLDTLRWRNATQMTKWTKEVACRLACSVQYCGVHVARCIAHAHASLMVPAVDELDDWQSGEDFVDDY